MRTSGGRHALEVKQGETDRRSQKRGLQAHRHQNRKPQGAGADRGENRLQYPGHEYPDSMVPAATASKICRAGTSFFGSKNLKAYLAPRRAIDGVGKTRGRRAQRR